MLLSNSALALLGVLTHAPLAFPQDTVHETEPNNSPATADTARLGGIVAGSVGQIAPDSIDYWTFTARAGDTIYVSVDGCEGCSRALFPVELLGADGVTVVPVNATWFGADAQLRYVSPISGRYYVSIFLNADLGDGPMRYAINFFRHRVCPEDPNEPNDSFATATPIARDATVRGRWCPDGDRDVFRVALDSGSLLEFWPDSVVTNTYSEPRLFLRDQQGRKIIESTLYPGGRVRYRVPGSGGVFYIEPQSWRGTETYGYRLQVRPSVTVTKDLMNEVEPNNRPDSASLGFLGGMVGGSFGDASDTVDYWAVQANAGDTIGVAVNACSWCTGDSTIAVDLIAPDAVTPIDVAKSYVGTDEYFSYVATAAGFYFLRVASRGFRSGHTLYFIELAPTPCLFDAGEPNNTIGTATPIAPNADVRARWCPGADVDLYQVRASAGTTLDITLDSIVSTAGGVARIVLRDSIGDTLKVVDILTAADTNHLIYQVQTTGSYYIEPTGFQWHPTDYYSLHVRESFTGLTVERAVRALLDSSHPLTPGEASYLDALGNQNGRYDVGDLRAFLAAQHLPSRRIGN